MGRGMRGTLMEGTSGDRAAVQAGQNPRDIEQNSSPRPRDHLREPSAHWHSSQLFQDLVSFRQD